MKTRISGTLTRQLTIVILLFTRDMSSVILKIGLHEDCEIHKQVLAVRETKDGWFDLCSPIEAVFCGSSIVWTQLVCFRT